MKKMLLVQSSSVIIGTVIGAGILGLPFAFVQAGFWTGMVVLALIAACILVLSLFFGEVTLRTKETHQLTGYTQLYLGKTAKEIQGLLLLFGMYSALLAYIIGQGEILSTVFGGNPVIWSIGAYFILSGFVIRGLEAIKKAEFLIGLLILGFLFTLAILSAPHIDSNNLSNFNLSLFFVPFGAVLFACSGLVAIPEAKEIVSKQKAEKLLLPAILIGNIIPVGIYACFAIVVVAVTGINTTQIATIGLSAVIGPAALAIGSLFSILAMSGSFMTLGTALKEIFQYDYGLKSKAAIFVTLIVPLAFFLFGIRNFFGIVSIAGALSVGTSGLISLITFWRARHLGKRKPEYQIPTWFAIPATILIAAVFIAGLIYTL